MVPRSAAPAQSHTKVGQLESNLADLEFFKHSKLQKWFTVPLHPRRSRKTEVPKALGAALTEGGGPTSTCTRDAATPPFSKFSPDPQKATQRGGGFGPEMGQQIKWKHGQHCISGISNW